MTSKFREKALAMTDRLLKSAEDVAIVENDAELGGGKRLVVDGLAFLFVPTEYGGFRYDGWEGSTDWDEE